MKLSFSNLGPIGFAEIEPKALTVICGKNNTGKTYISYSYFGLIDYLRNGMIFPVPEEYVNQLITEGFVEIPLQFPQEEIDLFLNKVSDNLSKILPIIFAVKPEHFKKSTIKASVATSEIILPSIFKAEYKSGDNLSLNIIKDKEENKLALTLFVQELSEDKIKKIKVMISNIISNVMKQIFFGKIFPSTMFASAERTGSLIFRDELTPARGHDMSNLFKKNYDSFDNIVENFSGAFYPLPILVNISFIKKLRSISLSTSPLAKNNPEVIDVFDSISGGKYTVDETGIYFSPRENSSLKLAMEESSSSVRSLVILSFWIRHMAKRGDMLMIDEPEMNLHPASQRILARWVAMLINKGIKVFITTHSDYFIKELNTLIMLHKRQKKVEIKNLMKINGINSAMLVNPKDAKIYVASREEIKDTSDNVKLSETILSEAPVDISTGFAVKSFDDTISSINALQENIIFNG